MPEDHRDGVNWPVIIKIAGVYAAVVVNYRMRRLGVSWPWRQLVPDLVQDAIVQAHVRKDVWMTGSMPDVDALKNLVKGRIRRQVGKLYSRQDEQNSSLDDLLTDNPNLRELSTEAHISSSRGIDVGAMLRPEAEMYHREFAERIESSLGKDEDGKAVANCMLNGTTKPQDIAEDTGLDTKLVNNVKKRVERKLKKELEESLLPNGRGISEPARKPDED